MSKIDKILKLGWMVNEMRYDKWQGWYYLGAQHDSGESVTSCSSESLADAISQLVSEAISKTPEWYKEQNK